MRIFFKDAVNDPPQGSGPFAVYNPDMINSLAAALPEVFGHQVFHIFGMESMQVQHAIDRDLDRIVFCHLPSIIVGMGENDQQRIRQRIGAVLFYQRKN
jgi:hypothetical protein